MPVLCETSRRFSQDPVVNACTGWSLRLSFGGGVELSFAFLSQKRVRGPMLVRVGKDCAIPRDLDDEGLVAAQRAKRVCFERVGRSDEVAGGEALAHRFVLPLALVARV